MNVKYSSNIQPCFLSNSSIILSNWAYWPSALIFKTFNWKSGGERMGVIYVIYCIRSSNTAELEKLVYSYSMEVRPRAVLSAHRVTPLYTVHDAEKYPPQAQYEYTTAALSSIEKKTVQGSEESEKPATYINKRADEVH
jgi:hypothetical protein